MSTTVVPVGYCYSLWLDAVNRCYGKEVFDLDKERSVIGPFPLVRVVLGRLYACAEQDLFVPSLRFVWHINFGWIYHVDRSYGVVPLKELLDTLTFSEARIGYDDARYKRTMDVRLSTLIKTAELDVSEEIPQAARRILREELNKDGHVLRDILMDLPK